jgi:hypothetical protein
MILNMWSNGGVWSGSMAKGGFAEMQVQWIEIAFNSSGDTSTVFGPQSVVCSIDKVAGAPEVVKSMANVDEVGLMLLLLSLGLGFVVLLHVD